MVAIGYAASGLCSDDVSYMEVAPTGELVREKWFKVPYYCMMHDFGITEDYLVLHIVPSIGSWERLEQGKPHFGFDTTMPVYLGVIPRRDDLKQEDIRWFKRDNCFASHVLNAWQEGSKIHFLTLRGEEQHVPVLPRCARRRSTRWRR
jgi:carotenoid cleavage dioxygenase-like enzyme